MPDTNAAEIAAMTMHAEFTQRRLRTQVTRTAARLRDLADEIDRIAGHIDSVPAAGTPMYANVASSVQHSVLWLVANLNLDQMTTTAAEADQVAAQIKAATAGER